MTKETQDSMAEMPEANAGSSGRNPRGTASGASSVTTTREKSGQSSTALMEAAVERENMIRAYKRVVANKGTSGVDGMTVDELKVYLERHWPRIREELLEGRYIPQPVLAVDIAKPGGGIRKLGIPTVADRLIQQAIYQVMEPLFDKDFSESSYGFRSGRNAHQAVKQAREYVNEGRRWVVDIDLEKFFDRVNHDILMARVSRTVKDKRILRVIRKYLQAGMMIGGILSPRFEGTPQGSPLSPLLSNIILDDLDKELERRDHKFCRYADDCNIYVKSKQAGERVMESISQFLGRRLKLKVNAEKSRVGRPWELKFLGYSMTWDKKARLKVASQSVARFKDKLRKLFQQGRGRNLQHFIEELNPILRGWMQYFHLAEVKNIFEELDGWIRHRLRNVLWQQWKRVYTRAKNLMKRGLTEVRAWTSATNGRGAWWNSGASHMNEAFPKSYFDKARLVSLSDLIRAIQLPSRTAVYGTVRTVV